jgi:glycine C-acetyltransferase
VVCRHNAQVFIDECHATGFFGATGKGTPEHCGVEGQIDVGPCPLCDSLLFRHVTCWCGLSQIINSTLGKAMGGATGGYTAGEHVKSKCLQFYCFEDWGLSCALPCTGPQEVIDLLRQKSRPYLFSNAVTPCVVAASMKAYELLEKDSSYVGTVRRNTHLFRRRLTDAGFTLKGDWFVATEDVVPVRGDAANVDVRMRAGTTRLLRSCCTTPA